LALLAFCADGYLTVTKKGIIDGRVLGEKGAREELEKRTGLVRFLSIATRIPFDVQTVMCNIMAGLSRQFIASKLVEVALTEVSRGWA